MRKLIIDTSTTTCSLSLFNDETLLESFHEVIGRGHAEILIPEIQKLTASQKVEQIFVNIGPGSFTGIRIGISAARALGLAWSIPCFGYTTMQLMAAMALDKAIYDNAAMLDITYDEAVIDIIMTGGHGEFYTQSFNKKIEAISTLMSLSPKQCAACCKAPLKAGDKAEVISHGKMIDTHIPDTRQFPLLEPFKPLEVKPLYIRPPDAIQSHTA